MLDENRLGSLRGGDVYDRNGDRIGTAGPVWTGVGDRPDWLSVKTGLFGRSESLVPLHGARTEGDRIVVDVDKDTVEEAPKISARVGEPLSAAEIGRLYGHYHLSPPGGDAGTDSTVA